MNLVLETIFSLILCVFMLAGLAACSKPREPIKIGISAWTGVEQDCG